MQRNFKIMKRKAPEYGENAASTSGSRAFEITIPKRGYTDEGQAAVCMDALTTCWKLWILNAGSSEF